MALSQFCTLNGVGNFALRYNYVSDREDSLKRKQLDLSIYTVPDLQTRHIPNHRKSSGCPPFTLWRHVIVWGSLLLSNRTWAAPKPVVPVSPGDPAVQAHPVLTDDLTPKSAYAVEPELIVQPQLRANHVEPELAKTLQQVPESSKIVEPTITFAQQSDSPIPIATQHGAAALSSLQPVGLTRILVHPPGDPLKAPDKLNSTLTQTPNNQTKPATQPAIDPELGILQLQEQSPPAAAPPATSDPTGQAPPLCENPDPELGCIRVKPLPLPQAVPTARQPVVYLIGRLDYFRSSNVFSGVDPIEDGLIRPGLSLFTAPALGPNTYFVGSIDGNLVRYSTQSEINYDELRIRAGIFQRLSPTMFGEIGWTNQQLFISGNKIRGLSPGTRFLNDNAIRLELSRRDRLTNRLSLNTFYQLYVSFAEPEFRSRVINSVVASLNYDIQPNFQAGLDYQFALADFTRQDRVDQYHQIVARLSYTAFRNTQLSVFGGYSFGNSTDRLIDFNSLILGVSMTVNVGLF